ncbi:MAG: two-component sensor histidine kinase [Crocinitomix sp.]|jgi:two-component sensor histidine kinase
MKQKFLYHILLKVCLIFIGLICYPQNALTQTTEERLAIGKTHITNYKLEEGIAILGDLYNDLLLEKEQDQVFLNEVRLSFAMVLEKSHLDEASLLLLHELEIDSTSPQLSQHEILGQITRARLNEKKGFAEDAHLNLDKAYAALQKTTDKRYLAKYHKRRASLIRVSSENNVLVFAHLDSALLFAKEFKDTLELGDIYMVKAIMGAVNNNYVQAEIYLDTAEYYWRNTTDEHAKLGILFNRAIFKLRQNEPLLALDYMDSTKLFHPEKYLGTQTGLLSCYLQIYERLDIKDSVITTLKALNGSLQEDHLRKDKLSIMLLNSLSRKNDLENELDKSEKEILIMKSKANTWYMLFFGVLLITALLFIFLRIGRKNRQEIHQQKITLERALADNQILFGEVHHRVKNNIAIISSMMQIQQREITDEFLKQKLIENELRIRSIGLVHTLIFNYDQIQTLKIGEYINKLMNGILETYNIIDRTTVEIVSKPIKADINIMVPIGLLMNELITNSVKYANVDNLKLTIELVQINENLSIIYRDNGKGFDINTCEKSFGLNMIQRMTRQIEGEIIFSPPGTHKIELNIPYNIALNE